MSELDANVVDLSLNFVLVGNNTLRANEQKFYKTILESLTPKSIENLEIKDEFTTPHSVRLLFDLPEELRNMSNKLTFEIFVNNEYNATYEKLANPLLEFFNVKNILHVNDLKYAKSKYKLKIRIKSKFSSNEESRWSDFVAISFKTTPKLPELIPEICENCFNIMDNGNVMLYWTEVQKQYQNGDGFMYNIQIWNEETLITNIETNKTQFIIDRDNGNLDVLKTFESLKVLIFSKNQIGLSKKCAQFALSLGSFGSSTKVLNIHKELINDTYKISWDHIEDSDIKSYTVVWCNQRNERSNQCDDAVEFQELPLNTTNFSLEATRSIQFGVAANSKHSQTGFQWAKCTAAKSNGKRFSTNKYSVVFTLLTYFSRNWPS